MQRLKFNEVQIKVAANKRQFKTKNWLFELFLKSSDGT